MPRGQTEGAPPYALVVFDCDGVLVDSERISVRVGTEVMSELGWSMTEAEVAGLFVACSAEHFNREAERGLGRALQADWELPYLDRYRRAFEAELTTVPGIETVLDELDRAGVAYCVASNSDHGHLHRVLGQTGLLERFRSRLFSAQDVARGKPAPDLYLHAAQQMGEYPQHCAVVEDGPFGVAAAHSAGMTCFAYAGGMTPRERLTGLGATLLDDLAAPPPLLTGRAVAHRG